MDNDFVKIIALAIMIEALVQTLKPIWQPERRTVEYYVGLVVGMILANVVNYLAGLDIFSAIGVPLTRAPAVAVILTGVLLSRGSSAVLDLVKLIEVLKDKVKAS